MAITGLLAYLITYSGFFEFGRVSQLICTFLGLALVILMGLIWLESKNEPQGGNP
jgi:FtsH-binding integral membrane protein